MKQFLLLLAFAFYILNSLNSQNHDNTQQTVKFLAIDGNYDYEILYYESDGKIESFINFAHSISGLNKGDKINITTTTETIEVAGDQSYHEEEVVTGITLLEKGILSRFLETDPIIQYKIDGNFSSYYDKLIKDEINLFLAATESPNIRDLFERKDEGTIVVWATRFIPERDGVIDDMEEHETPVYCSISYETDSRDEAVLRFALIPDYAKSRYYGITQYGITYPITFDY